MSEEEGRGECCTSLAGWTVACTDSFMPNQNSITMTAVPRDMRRSPFYRSKLFFFFFIGFPASWTCEWSPRRSVIEVLRGRIDLAASCECQCSVRASS